MKKIAIASIFVSLISCYAVENSVFSLKKEVAQFVSGALFDLSIRQGERDFWVKLLTDIPEHPAMLNLKPLSHASLTNKFFWIIRSNIDWTLLEKMKLVEARIELLTIEEKYKKEADKSKLHKDEVYQQKKCEYDKIIDYYNKNSPHGIQQTIKYIALKEATDTLLEAITKYQQPTEA